MMRERLLSALIFLGSSTLFAQDVSKYIVVDQFGYLPGAAKIAVIRNPQQGYDAEESFSPGTWYQLVDAQSGEAVYRSRISSWKNGNTDASSGDKAWHFDFSAVEASGDYYVMDEERNVRSYTFRIAPNVYNELLKEAMRTFFYQRVGYEKKLPYAEAAWEDEASHSGDLQDNNCRSWYDKNNPDTERDVSGGWYDAGDFNKYTNWTANYVCGFMLAYLERPEAWADDYNIPESGDGIPDILNEAMYGVDHLLRMQQEDGSVLSVVGEDGASPPSTATDPSYYGPPNTSATRNTSAAFALASKVYRQIGLSDYADTLVARALRAWAWAELHPDSLFRNNDASWGSGGLAAGQQEVSDYGREMIRLEAACYLWEVTGDEAFREIFDDNYRATHIFQWNGYVFPFEVAEQDLLLYYTTIEGATPAVVDDIMTTYAGGAINGSENLSAYRQGKDPYRAHIKDYTWGSNNTKSKQGSIHYNLITYGMSDGVEEDARESALGFLHYIHGTNPLNMTFLSNMYGRGAENCVNEFYHTWFTNGSPLWDRVGTSTYGPAPGFLTGGPNPGYDVDGCCPSGCGSSGNNAACTAESTSPPKNQPDQKSYKDFNTSWPLNSWSVTENSCGYQISYIRLLSKFVSAGMDCHGDVGGSAFIDSCGTCAGGNTGLDPVLDPAQCQQEAPDGDSMYIEGRHLYTAAGEKVILRGVNEMFAWGSDYDGSKFLPEIDQTGANCVRIVWAEDVGRKDDLVDLIEHAIDRKMIAMPECHSATGEWENLDVCINFWKDPVLLEGIQRNRRWTLVNIGNEVGDGSVTAEQFKSGYMRAIDSLRLWGYTVPLVIDASTWGQNLQVILDTWEEIQAHDPLHNILFSVHSYWSDESTYDRVASASTNLGLPIIIGEGPSPTAYPVCAPLDYARGLDVCGRNDIGWLGWSWGGVPNGHCVPDFDHTDGGIFGHWRTPAGEDMMAAHEYSLMNTAQRPESFYEDAMVQPSGIYFTVEEGTLKPGDSLRLHVQIMPVNAITKVWQVEVLGEEKHIGFNPASAYIHAFSPGTNIIRLSFYGDDSFSYSDTIVVDPVNLDSIVFEPQSLELAPGESASFLLHTYPEDASNPAYTFSLSDPDSVIILDTLAYTITGRQPGSASLEARWTDGEVVGSLDIVVRRPDYVDPSAVIPGFRLYPNPAQQEVHVEFDGGSGTALELLDLSGRKILHMVHHKYSLIDLSRVEAGTYVLRLPWEGRMLHTSLVVL